MYEELVHTSDEPISDKSLEGQAKSEGTGW
jgi:hypothetical protein